MTARVLEVPDGVRELVRVARRKLGRTTATPRAADLTAMALYLALALPFAAVEAHTRALVDSTPLVLLILLAAAPLTLLRRSRPWTAFVLGCVPWIVAGDRTLPIILIYALGRYRAPWQGLLAALITAGSFVFGFVRMHLPLSVTGYTVVGAALAEAFMPYVLGLAFAQRAAEREREAQLHREVLRQTLQQARLRIAHDLHDIIGHQVTVQVMKAELLAGRTADPALREGAEELAGIGRFVIAQLRDMVRVLADPGGRADATGEDALDVAVDQLRRAGIDLRMTGDWAAVVGELGVLPAAELRVILMEALTNVAKHAGPGPVRLDLAHTASGLRATVVNALSVPPDRASALGGTGLESMARRAHGLGGFLVCEATEDAFTVRVDVPVAR